MEKLRGLSSPKVAIGEVRGLGLMIGVELVKDPESKEPAARITSGRHLAYKSHSHGILRPPLCL